MHSDIVQDSANRETRDSDSLQSTADEDTIVVSILICTRDRAEHLRQTLDSLSRVQVPEAMPCELIVVDNGSTDDTAQVLASFRLPQMPLRAICDARPGKMRALNTALAQARGRVIVSTDDDVRFPIDWIANLCGPVARGEADAVAGGIRFAAHLERPWMTPLHRSRLASTENHRGEPRELIGANMAFSRDVLDRVPAFDEELGPGALGFYDDTLFSSQMLEAGFHFKAAYETIVEHHFQESRLKRSSLEDATRKHAHSAAYVEYHWEHRSISKLRMRAAKSRLVLLYWRARNWRERAQLEGLSEAEMHAIWSVAFYRQFAIERKRHHQYLRRGLTKLRTD